MGSWRHPPLRCPRPLAVRRNWDYRFCWLRDATLTLESLMRGGFYEEAMAWRSPGCCETTAGDPSQMQIMYGAGGERRLDEWEVDWLPGYEGSAAGPDRQCRRRVSSSSTSTARSCRPSTSRLGPTDGRATAQRGSFSASLMEFLGDRLASARRRHLGGAGTAPPLHPLQGDGLGGHRSGDQDRRGAWVGDHSTAGRHPTGDLR